MAGCATFARSFVKAHTEQQLLYEQGAQVGPSHDHAKHPANAVHEQASAWTKKWNSVQTRDWTELSNLLQGVQRPQPCQVLMRVTAEQLQQNAKAMSNKVSGADSWEARDLVRLPTEWWELAAAIWNRSLEHGKLPKAWCQAKVVLLWKKQVAQGQSLFSRFYGGRVRGHWPLTCDLGASLGSRITIQVDCPPQA